MSIRPGIGRPSYTVRMSCIHPDHDPSKQRRQKNKANIRSKSNAQSIPGLLYSIQNDIRQSHGLDKAASDQTSKIGYPGRQVNSRQQQNTEQTPAFTTRARKEYKLKKSSQT